MRVLVTLNAGLVLFGVGLWLGLVAGLGVGLGTLLNVVLIGATIDVLLATPRLAGTLLFALGIGPAVQVAFRVLRQTPIRRPLGALA